jgi:hypothetical protein
MPSPTATPTGTVSPLPSIGNSKCAGRRDRTRRGAAEEALPPAITAGPRSIEAPGAAAPLPWSTLPTVVPPPANDGVVRAAGADAFPGTPGAGVDGPPGDVGGELGGAVGGVVGGLVGGVVGGVIGGEVGGLVGGVVGGGAPAVVTVVPPLPHAPCAHGLPWPWSSPWPYP